MLKLATEITQYWKQASVDVASFNSRYPLLSAYIAKNYNPEQQTQMRERYTGTRSMPPMNNNVETLIRDQRTLKGVPPAANVAKKQVGRKGITSLFSKLRNKGRIAGIGGGAFMAGGLADYLLSQAVQQPTS